MSQSERSLHPQFPLRRFIREITDGPFGSSLTSSHYSDDGARVIRLGNIGPARFKDGDAAFISMDYFNDLRRHEVKPEDLLIAGLGDENHSVGRACVAPSNLGPSIVKADCFRVRLDQGRLLHRYAAWALSSPVVSGQVLTLTRGSTRARINLEVARDVQLPVPPLEEQSRIVDFLDAETARIDRLVHAREAQISLLGQRLAQLVDGVVAGEREVIDSIGTRADSDNWDHGKISRFCEVIPGYAFPSSAFVTDGSGIRLLRGTNVGVGNLVWEDVVSWDATTHPVPERFHLRTGDLVLGMDRPWISSGMRIALIDESEVPAFLLQRVACLRSKSPNISMHFIHWVLRSTQFRLGVESEMTGVSVPHLSGEQIGSFTFSLPTFDEQTRLAASLEHHDSSTRRLKAAMNKQVSLLTERRQALITAAVTGQFDVTTASGRNVTDGVTA
ncbi:restriction endonuclease subunit S [Streptomyces sp. NPDC085612]|uniref:restriction endonuclease subunit S n=1 Tax=Streptomyces sp. NPDC085612 TaxID=3365732 RepID=UPI0037D3EDCC